MATRLRCRGLLILEVPRRHWDLPRSATRLQRCKTHYCWHLLAGLRNGCAASRGPWSTGQNWLKGLRRQQRSPADVEGRPGLPREHRTFHHWPGHAHGHCSLCRAANTVPSPQRPESAFVFAGLGCSHPGIAGQDSPSSAAGSRRVERRLALGESPVASAPTPAASCWCCARTGCGRRPRRRNWQ